MVKYTVYNAFNGISPFEKLGIIKFLETQIKAPRTNIQHAVDYAVKDCPSFGGFIFSAVKEDHPIAVAVVNRSGLEAYQVKNQLVYFAISPKMQKKDFTKSFFDKVVEMAGGDLSLHLNPDSSEMSLFKQLGFQVATIELRFSPIAMSQAV